MAAPKVLICGFDTTGAGVGFENPIAVDANGNIAVTIRDPLDPTIEPNVVRVNADGEDPTGASFAAGLETASVLYGLNPTGLFDRLRSDESDSDAIATNALGILQALALQMGFDGTHFQRVRVANVFKSVFVTAVGPTAVWTPAAGKKFRLMGYTIDIAGTAAATAPQRVVLLDAAAAIKQHVGAVIQTQTVSISGGGDHIAANLGQGQLSAVANNALNVTLSIAMATGGVAINAWGTEE